MNLTSVFLNVSNREVRRCLADSHALHVKLMALFGSVSDAPPRTSLQVLYRTEVDDRHRSAQVLLQSREVPDFARWSPGLVDEARPPRTIPLEPLLDDLRGRYRFRLRANATRKVATKTRADGTKSNGRRLALRSDDERLAWLERQCRPSGFRIAKSDDGSAMVRLLPGGCAFGQRKASRLTHEGALFEGVLVVEDANQLRAAVIRGIGPGKAYGFGLLSLAPLR